MQFHSLVFATLVALAAAADDEPPQQHLRSPRDLQWGGGGGGNGWGGGGGGGGGGGHHQTIQNLLDSAEQDLIERSWTTQADGTVVTTTTSDDDQVADWLVEHVLEMKDLADNGGSVRRWDPLFRQIFDNADDIALTVKDIDNGVKVWLKGSNACADDLIQKHVRVVDDFVARGRNAAQQSHSRSNQCN